MTPRAQAAPCRSETEVKAEIVKRCERHKAAYICTSQPSRTRKQFRGIPDLFIFMNDHLLMVETKTTGKEARLSQIEFQEKIHPHLGSNVQYLVTDDPDVVEMWLIQKKPSYTGTFTMENGTWISK